MLVPKAQLGRTRYREQLVSGLEGTRVGPDLQRRWEKRQCRGTREKTAETCSFSLFFNVAIKIFFSPKRSCGVPIFMDFSADQTSPNESDFCRLFCGPMIIGGPKIIVCLCIFKKENLRSKKSFVDREQVGKNDLENQKYHPAS